MTKITSIRRQQADKIAELEALLASLKQGSNPIQTVTPTPKVYADVKGSDRIVPSNIEPLVEPKSNSGCYDVLKKHAQFITLEESRSGKSFNFRFHTFLPKEEYRSITHGNWKTGISYFKGFITVGKHNVSELNRIASCGISVPLE